MAATTSQINMDRCKITMKRMIAHKWVATYPMILRLQTEDSIPLLIRKSIKILTASQANLIPEINETINLSRTALILPTFLESKMSLSHVTLNKSQRALKTERTTKIRD